MRLVVCSDAHLDARTSGVPRFNDVASAMRQSVEAAIKSQADMWAFLGDLCDPDDGPDVVRAVTLAGEFAVTLRDARVRSVWVMGNHDAIEDGSGGSTLSPLRALGGGVQVFEEPGLVVHGEVPIVVLPYSPVSKPFDLAEHARMLTPRVRQPGVVLGHATHIEGARQGEETLEMPRGRAVRLPVEEFPTGWTVLNGHFHTPQTTPQGVIIPGALARLTHGEESNEPRFLIVEV